MHDPFFPQLALFVASRPLLTLYREFIFPSVPSKTGLLPLGIDDVRAANAENTSIALDIALTRAAVVVYDPGRRPRLPLDYVRARRGSRPMIEVAAPPDRHTPPDVGSERLPVQPVLGRPAEMSGWPESFIEPLLGAITRASPTPSVVTVGQELERRESAAEQEQSDEAKSQSYAELLLTALALLERRIRIEASGTAVPVDPSGGVMQRLRQYFGPSHYDVVMQGVSLRHAMLEGVMPPLPALQAVATALARIARVRYNA